MAVQFILGRSGTGKTRCCIETIVGALLQKDDQPLLFLVPEQATYQASRAILSDTRIAGYNRLGVLSFDRLVYLLLGKNVARPAISRLGRTMVIQRILRDCADKLNIFGGSAKLPGLGKRLADTITQLQQYANDPDDVKGLVSKLQKQSADFLTTAKFADIAIVFEEYLKFIEGRFLDSDIQLTAACKAIAKADFLKGAKLWVDGFAGFTAGELALLTELLKAVCDAQIALCLDPTTADLTNPDRIQIDPTGLFGTTEQTYAELVERIKKCKLEIVKPIIFDKPHRFSGSPPLGHIERNIFVNKPKKISANGQIRIVSAPNARAEVQFVARQITKLVRYDGYRYRDIAVIASDIDSYENYIKASFEDYNIPVFIDKRKPLSQHPVIELISSALAAVTNDFPTSEIFAYLKTDLTRFERSDVDLLENYCVAFGITASDWASDRPWRFAGNKAAQFDEQHVDGIRKKVIQPLLELRRQLVDDDGKSKMLSPEQFTKIIFDFLETTGVRDRLAFWVEQALQQGDFAAADEHRQLFDRLVDVFDELVEAFADAVLSCEDYLAIMRSAFSQMTLAFIPPNLDQVLVGSIERSRHPDLRVVFLIGVTERQFPTPVVFDGILSEEDHLAAASSGFDLPPGVRQELANRPYLAYIAFTRPSELLCITYPALDQKSNAVVRSPFVDDLCLLFDDLEAESIASTFPAIEDVYNRYELEDALCSGSSELRGILQEILADDQLPDIGLRVERAIGYENKATLEAEVITRIFGQQLTSSASRLSAFAACPYKHFARYVLELKKRDEFKLEPLDLGDFYHRALDSLVKRAVADKVDFATIQPAALVKILNEEIEKLCRDDSFISKFRAHSPHNTFIVRSATEYLQDCVVALSQMVRAGSFRPAMSEISFGQPKSQGPSIGEFKITLSDGRSVCLNGRIDRLDVATVGGKKIALVFDYKKRSESSFSWAEFFYGLDIQLAIYMLAVRNAADVHKIANDVAGAFYLPIEASPKSVDIGKAVDNKPEFAHKARGIFNGEYAGHLDTAASKDSRFYNFFVTKDGQPYGRYTMLGAIYPADFEAFLKFCSRKIAALAEQTASGKIAVSPYRLGGGSPCSHCDYKPVCRFDWQINDYNILTSVNKQQVLEQIANTDGSKKD
ncbi:MAG: PD-(D/E)XK nuclease family protein [Planctomycetota bacterium]